MQVRLKVQNYDDREKMIIALANSGYCVWVEEEKIPHHISSQYYVVFEWTEQPITMSLKEKIGALRDNSGCNCNTERYTKTQDD